MRSARLALFATAGILICLPLLFLGVAMGYERWLEARTRASLVAEANSPANAAAWVRVIARDGEVLAQSTPDPPGALTSSPLDALLEAVGRGAGWNAPGESLVTADQSLGALAARPEVISALNGMPAFHLEHSASGATELFS